MLDSGNLIIDTKQMLDPIARELYAEIHARPLPSISLPCSAWQVLIKTTNEESRQVIRHFYLLKGQTPPEDQPRESGLLLQLDGCEVRLERHREFCSFLFIQHSINEETILDDKPPYSAEWLNDLPGTLLICNSVKLIPDHYQEIDKQRIQNYFEDQRIIGSYLLDSQASVWTSFRLHNDSARYVVFVADLSSIKTGYLLQQLVEFEAYRIMALLGFPRAKELVQELALMNDTLADILQRLPDAEHFAEQELLLEITSLSAKIEALQVDSSYRFRATRAYYELVNERLANLHEEPFEEMSTISTFLGRRFGPAMRTCESIQAELIQLSGRVASASSLLQVRVSVSMEEQNKELLASMDQRGHQQLRLQETVEGLSVAAITYYIVGLLEKVFKLSDNLPWSVEPKTLTAISIVPVVLLVWLGVRRVRTRINNHD